MMEFEVPRIGDVYEFLPGRARVNNIEEVFLCLSVEERDLLDGNGYMRGLSITKYDEDDEHRKLEFSKGELVWTERYDVMAYRYLYQVKREMLSKLITEVLNDD